MWKYSPRNKYKSDMYLYLNLHSDIAKFRQVNVYRFKFVLISLPAHRVCGVVYDLQHFQDFLVHYDVIYKEVPYNVGLTRLVKLVALIWSYEVEK